MISSVRTTISHHLFLYVLLLLVQTIVVCTGVVYSQPMSGSDECNEGWAIAPRVDPRDRNIHCMRYWGLMRGWLTGCENAIQGEEYASQFMALGDLNGDKIADWGVQRNRCDIPLKGRPPVEWLIYYGVRGGLPLAESGERVGISEIHSRSRLLCSGDWDGDGVRDIAMSVEIMNDTSYGNVEGYSLTSLIIFWGQSSGHFTLSDTTRLSCGGAEKCLSVLRGVTCDFDGDGVDDLFVWGGGSLSQGAPVQTAPLHVFGGRRDRWRAVDVPRVGDIQWWNIPPMNRFGVADQDCDGHADVILYNDMRVGTGHVSVLYGRAGQLPDTSEVETIDLVNSNGHFSMFTDLTGDRVAELVVNCGSQETIKVYAGSSGRRLRDQYGDGMQPWADVSLPLKIHDGWTTSGFVPFLELGDGDLDGYDDLWLSSPPFILGYSGWGRYLDWQIDMAFRWGAVLSASSLGDIDGSGVASFGVSFGGVPGGMALYKGTDSAKHLGIYRALPHGVTEVCLHSAGVSAPGAVPVMPGSLPHLSDIHPGKNEVKE